MDLLGKACIAAGVLLVAIGAVILIARRVPFIGRLPGDIRVEGENYTFYFPVVTCLFVSALLTLVMWLISRFRS